MKQLWYSEINSEAGQIHLVKTSKGICYIGSPDGSFEELEKQLFKKYGAFELIKNDDSFSSYKQELQDYFTGKIQQFTLPLDAKGTVFQKQVWEALLSIPYGESRSYSDIARQIGKPSAVRAVGGAIGANPVLMWIPCHRVMGKSGAITGFRAGISFKKYLRQLEASKELGKAF